MIKFRIAILFMLLIIQCSQSDSDSEDIVSKYSNLIKTIEDSLTAVIIDSLALNPIIQNLSSENEWILESKHWRQNPFKSLEKTVEPKKTKARKKIVFVDETKNLSLNGIIQVKDISKALINGQLYEIGDSIDNLKIIDIGKKEITLRSRRKIYRLYLNEN